MQSILIRSSAVACSFLIQSLAIRIQNFFAMATPVLPPTPDLRVLAMDLGLNSVQRHIFLYADQTEPKCCAKEAGLASWDYLKKRLKELGLLEK